MQAIFRNHTSSGFTIVELVVVITVMTLLTGLLFGPLTDLYTSNTSSSAQVTQDSDTRSALRQIASDLSYSNGFIGTIIAPTTPTGSNDGINPWLYTVPSAASSTNVDANTQVLMAKVFATDLPYSDQERKPIGSGSCDLTLGSFVQNTYIYFVKSGTLYRRMMVNSPATGTPCASTPISQQQSCRTISTPTCPAADAVLLKNVTSFLIDYDNPAVTFAKSAKITLKAQPNSSSSPINPTEATIRISLVQQSS